MDMRLDGLATGMDTRNIVEQLTEIERKPIEDKEQDIQEINQTQEIWQQINKELVNFQNAADDISSKDAIGNVVVESDHDNIEGSATLDALDMDGENISIDVKSVAQKHEVRSIEVSDADNELGEELEGFDPNDEISFNMGLENEDREIEEFSLDEDVTLNELADEINSKTQETGVSASIMNIGFGDEEENLLILEAEDYNEEIKIEDDESNLMQELGIIDEEGDIIDNRDDDDKINGVAVEPQKAVAEINGVETDSNDNIFEPYDGVTIDINGLAESVNENENENDVIASANLSISQDIEGAQESIENFIKSYNKTKELIDEYSGENAPLQGDSTLRMIDNQLRRAVSQVVPGSNSEDDEGIVPGNKGIEFDSDPERLGYLLEPNEENFMGESVSDTIRQELENNPEEMIELFTDEEDGIGSRVSETVGNFVDPGGMIDTREENLDDEIGRLENRIDRREDRVERKEQRLWSEFMRMEEAIQEMYAMQDSMRQQLDQLSGARQQQ